jgi:signal transduction histidine kinase
MFVETIRKNILSMQVLVEDISDVIKMRTGRIRSDAKMDMAKNILLAVEKANKDLAAERNITLEFDIPSGLPFVNLDTNRVTQALNKLVDNAVKYSPEGSKVLITARPAEGGLEILIKDDGVGMSAEELEQLGNLFFRGDDELVTNTKGYGMGIPIALECMNLVGGRLFYESEKGKGSLFGVFLPGMS